MWQSILCYLSGQHEFTVACEPEAVFLQCRSCGRRSSGWALRSADTRVAAPVHATTRRNPELVLREHHSA
jgi:hypothetical protein